MSAQVYVGPYLEIREPSKLRRVDRCKYHGRLPSDLYCPKCGCQSGHRYTTHRDGSLTDGFFNHGQWVDHLVLAFTVEMVDYSIVHAIPNRPASDGSRFGLWLDCETAAYPLPTLGTFEAEHALEIARIIELGCTVAVKLGIVSWYM